MTNIHAKLSQNERMAKSIKILAGGALGIFFLDGTREGGGGNFRLGYVGDVEASNSEQDQDF